jgi:hypothetical protein
MPLLKIYRIVSTLFFGKGGKRRGNIAGCMHDYQKDMIAEFNREDSGRSNDVDNARGNVAGLRRTMYKKRGIDYFREGSCR